MAKVEAKKKGLSDERLRDFLREMLLIRRFEEMVEERFRAGELPGFLHVAIGQEAVAVGVCAALEEDDVIASTHRAHGHTLARGTSPNALMAELYGKLEGCSHGYGGSMHLYDVERGNLGANAVVGGGLPAITGAALAFKFRKEPRVALAFFGDGATNIGTFHESLNLAQLWNVPAVFVPREQLVGRVDAELAALADHGLHAARGRVRDALDQGRRPGDRAGVRRRGRGDRPRSPRATGRCCWWSTRTASSATTSATRRSTARRASSRSSSETQDPITKLRERLGVTDEEFEQLDAEVTREVEESVEFAKNGTDPKPEDALKNIYA